MNSEPTNLELNKKDMINPDHYKSHKFECIEELEIVFGTIATINFCKMNAWKYRHRCGLKDDVKQEQDKVDWYLSKAKELEEKLNTGKAISSCF